MTSDQLRRFIPYEIPLNDMERARMVLPEDLTQAEADRICGVIQSLAFPPTQDPSSPSSGGGSAT